MRYRNPSLGGLALVGAAAWGQADLGSPYFGGAPPRPAFVMPESLGAWPQQREGIRSTLWALLGDLPPRPAPVRAELVSRERRAGYVLEKLVLDNGAGAPMPAYLLVPEGLTTPAPAVLYHHYHGGQYDNGKEELSKTDHPVPGASPAEAFTRRGYVVLCIDALCFGERRRQGPAGAREEGAATELSLFKMLAWQGRTLWGMMVRDDQIALDYLCSRPEVDPGRIAALGMSMGSTRTWWLAALDERVKVSVCVACLTRYQDLIHEGLLSAHGIYYYVPNMLRHFDTEAVVALIAPRPLLTLTGDQDSGSPVEGVRTISATCEALYRLHGAPEQFRGIVYPGVGHEWTEGMWSETLAWLERWL